METKNYSLEKHLEAICNDDKDYAVLLAVWRLNKENLSAALRNVASMFPHYSQHDLSHSIKILDNIQRLLGRDRVESLGATDTFLLLMSALTHDLGMYMTYEMVEKKWKEPEMKKLLETYADSSDKQIAAAARLLLNRSTRPDKPADGYRWALEIRNAVTLILAHQMRGRHGDRSAEHLEKSDFFWQYSSGFHFDALPGRYLTLIAQVAHLHGTGFDEVLKLPQTADGFKSDYIHPRFIACMIRMGDLLDIDNNRFNLYSMATVKEVPDSSQAHYDKHQAVKHLLISPEGIEATLDCPTEASFRVAREVFDWLESEVEKLCREWSVIAPPDMGGLPPVLHKDKINIFYKGARTRPELRNLRFEISSRRTFEMLKGGAIYRDPGLVFLREIVQNAMDATKLQIWKDMDILLPFDFEKPERHFKTRQELKEKAFSDDIPAEVYQKYPVELKVDYDEKNQAVIVTCEDRGTGISEESLIRMTSQVGASRRADKDYEKTIGEMPYFLQPTAAFGLGLQTVFYVADEFTVDTHYPGEPSRRIVFRTSTNGSYCSIEKEDLEDWNVAHGTKVRIVIDKDHLGKLFELDKEDMLELVNNPEISYKHISNIDSYAKRNFVKISEIAFGYQSPFLEFQTEIGKENYECLDKDIDERYRLYGLRRSNDDEIITYLIEDRKLGGEFEIRYKTSERHSFGGTRVLFRSIPVEFYRWWWSDFASINLNLFSREADKLVSISRDDLLPQGEDWCRDAIDGALPAIVRLTHRHLLNLCKHVHTKEVSRMGLIFQYRSLCLLNWNIPNPINLELETIGVNALKISHKVFAENQFFDNNLKPVQVKSIIESEKIIVVDGAFMIPSNLKMRISSISDAIVTFAGSVIPDSYVCSEVFFIEGENGYDVECKCLVKDSSGNIIWVNVLDTDIRKFGLSVFYSEDFSGGNLFGLSNYMEIVVGNNAPLLGFVQPYHGNCWIYPIGIDFIMSLPDSRVEADKFLREEDRMEKAVPEYIVKLIMKYNALGKEYPKSDEDYRKYKELIHNTYIRLILDNRFGVEKPS